MSEMVLTLDLIVSNPDIRHGRPVIAGTGLRVQDVAAAYVYRHESLSEIEVNYDLTSAQVHAALAYFFAHQEAMLAQMQADDEAIQQAKESGFGQQGKTLFG